MKHLLLLLAILFVSALAHAQQGNTLTIRYAGVPTGTCGPFFLAVNNATSDEYNCTAGGAWNKISSSGGTCPEGTCVVNAPAGNQTILGNHELNIPGLVGAGTSVDGYLNVGPAITALSAYAQTVALPANEFSLNITTNEPDLTHNFAAAQFVLDAATTFSNVINVFAAVKLAANDTTGVTLEGNFTEANVNLNGHTTTSGITGTQSNAQLNGTGTLGGNNIGIQAIPVFQNGTQSATSSWGVDSFAFNLPAAVTLTLSGEAAAFHATTPAVNAQTITVPINAQFLAEPNSGTTPTLNAEFYGKDNGTGSPDYFIYDAGTLVKSKLGALTVGTLTSNGTVTAPTYATSGSNSAITGIEGTGSNCTAAASTDCLWPDSTAHRWKMNNNNAGALNTVGITTAGTSGHEVKLAANGLDIVDSGVPFTATGGMDEPFGFIGTITPAGGAAVATANVPFGVRFVQPVTITCTKITTLTNITGGAGSHFGVAFYDTTGQTLIASTGALDGTVTTRLTTTVSSFTLVAGVSYILSWTSTSTVIGYYLAQNLSFTSAAALFNTGSSTNIVVGGTATSGGAPGAAMGTLSAGSGSNFIPVVYIEN